jgi:hypothetical protein
MSNLIELSNVSLDEQKINNKKEDISSKSPKENGVKTSDLELYHIHQAVPIEIILHQYYGYPDSNVILLYILDLNST